MPVLIIIEICPLGDLIALHRPHRALLVTPKGAPEQPVARQLYVEFGAVAAVVLEHIGIPATAIRLIIKCRWLFHWGWGLARLAVTTQWLILF